MNLLRNMIDWFSLKAKFNSYLWASGLSGVAAAVLEWMVAHQSFIYFILVGAVNIFLLLLKGLQKHRQAREVHILEIKKQKELHDVTVKGLLQKQKHQDDKHQMFLKGLITIEQMIEENNPNSDEQAVS